ncbi:MAG: LicD family protein [Lachnospiraceae bacterium]|nr:LicD family protein [Lachnospiraceae bacterium]
MRTIRSVTEYKQIILEAMIYIEDVCRKNGIYCYLAGGTMLGSVRHKGFIPWDDDADMIILRADYNRLIDLINRDESPYRALTVWNDRDYYYPFCKVVDTRTYLEEGNKLPIRGDGVCVDLFPLDHLPADKHKIVRLFYAQGKLRELYDRRFQISDHAAANPVYAAYVRWYLRSFAKLIDRTAQILSHETPAYAACSVWGYGIKEVMPLEGVQKAKRTVFEGHEFKMPAAYRIYLSRLYGDYMTPPPKAKQHNEHMARAWWRD